jgi:hypothetical protein
MLIYMSSALGAARLRAEYERTGRTILKSEPAIIAYRPSSLNTFVSIPSNLGVDSIMIGFYRGANLYYAARARAGLSRQAADNVRCNLAPEDVQMSIRDLPQKDVGRWGQGFTAEKMKEAIWIRPEAVAQIEFLE